MLMLELSLWFWLSVLLLDQLWYWHRVGLEITTVNPNKMGGFCPGKGECRPGNLCKSQITLT